MLELVLMALLGLAVGAYGTIIGAGGGFILVPLLLFIFPGYGPEKVTAISLAVVWANATSGSIAYARQRQAFGGPLTGKQVIRHKLADLATLIEAGRWLTYAACLKFRNREEVVKEISMVKLFTAEIANRVAYDCVQIHGGYGYMREYPIERFARDVRLFPIGVGTSEIMKEIIAKEMEL